MREIKFRGWHTVDRQMISPVYVGSHRVRWLEGERTMESDDTLCIPLQFTGLKDENRKEIYEGDILKIGSLIYTIEWRDWRKIDPGFSLVDPKMSRYDTIVTSSNGWEDGKVIGNIYENPELLG